MILGLLCPTTAATAQADKPEAPADRPAAEAPPAEEEERPPIFLYPIYLRLHGGIGLAQRARDGDQLGVAAIGGVQLMLPANARQSFGIEVDYVQTDARQERRYIMVGLFVENRMFGWFLMSLGLAGFISVDDPRPIPWGISTKLGWAPDLHPVINPFVVFRTDTIFADRFQGILSANGGISLKF